MNCTWRRVVPLATLYCRGLEQGHDGPHAEEVLSPSNVHADVLRAFVEGLAERGDVGATIALDDAEAAALAVREGRYPPPGEAS